MIFPPETRADFAQNYPETPHILRHNLRDDGRLTLDALADLAEALPDQSIEYNRADLPIGVDPDAVEANGLSIANTIRTVDTNHSWAVLKNIEQVPAYNALLMDLLGELRSDIERRTGPMLNPQGFIFVSSPNAVTPFHFDPEHNILLQLKGSKVMTQFPPNDDRMVPAVEHERYFLGGHRNLTWREDFAQWGQEYPMAPGDALFVPVMAPHHVRVDGEPSISLSITWRSEWSYAEADAHAMNAVLRKIGVQPRRPGRFPIGNRIKALSWRALRRTPIGARFIG
jgi:Cupin-like domain